MPEIAVVPGFFLDRPSPAFPLCDYQHARSVGFRTWCERQAKLSGAPGTEDVVLLVCVWAGVAGGALGEPPWSRASQCITSQFPVAEAPCGVAACIPL